MFRVRSFVCCLCDVMHCLSLCVYVVCLVFKHRLTAVAAPLCVGGEGGFGLSLASWQAPFPDDFFVLCSDHVCYCSVYVFILPF